MLCPICKSFLPDDATICNRCGHSIKREREPKNVGDGKIQCPGCGKILPSTVNGCYNCKTKFIKKQESGTVSSYNKVENSKTNLVSCPNCGKPIAPTSTVCLYCKSHIYINNNESTAQVNYQQDTRGFDNQQQTQAGATNQLYGNTPYGQQTPYNGSGPLYNQNVQQGPYNPTQQAGYYAPPQHNNNEKKPGCLIEGIIAFCLLFTCLAPIGIILMWVYKVPKNAAVRVIATILFGILFVFGLWSIGGRSSDDTTDTNNNTSTSSQLNTDEKNETEEKTEEETTEEVAENDITVASDYSDMKIGEICKDEDLYVGLSYAKLSNSFTTGLGSEEEIASDKQVLFAFFDVYNSGEKQEYVDDNLFSCYVDGTNYNKVETYFYYDEDGVTNQYSTILYNNTCKLMITNFEIPLEWNEIKLYYGSDCIWTLSPDDVSSDSFEFESMYDIDYMQSPTGIGESVYSDDFDLIFDGYEYYTRDYDGEKYIVFKFTINNTCNSVLDYSLAGYDMVCYADNYVTEEASYTVNDKIGDYVNIFDLDSIQAGMSGKIYVAYKIKGEHSFYRMVYNDGYITDNYIADIFVLEEGATDSDATEE